jgi:MFS superfamily sulfate permease-like transporter
LLVVLLPIEIGVGLAIGLSALHSLYTIARPQAVELARIPGTTVWWTIAQGEPGEHEPGVLVFAFGAPLNFMNVGYLLDRLAAAIAADDPPCRLVVIEASGVIGIDFTGARLFLARVAALRSQGIAVAMARLESEDARQAARRTGILSALGEDHVFRSVEEAVRALGTRSAG